MRANSIVLSSLHAIWPGRKSYFTTATSLRPSTKVGLRFTRRSTWKAHCICLLEASKARDRYLTWLVAERENFPSTSPFLLVSSLNPLGQTCAMLTS
ncbi:hypothetical protein LshimejAT787_1400960 [Lyophyllum shimeji]|uniref:Uncharacterized protein n=1 Tax=Lyophyllum shimeji TaxID=47721 RepID=A0A9P3UQ75_LYOSH|nr:hypothetical protein LshimejAT787_1400960 [Lyophyllum shimeji]